MAVSPGRTLLLFLLIYFGLLDSSPLDSCPDFCTCEQFLRLNCSSAGLSSAPPNVRTSISELDLSNNRLGALTFNSKFYSLQKVWLGNSSVTRLSLCVDSDSANGSRFRRSLGPRGRARCLLWAPTLHLLSAERNQLQALPDGLGQQRTLRILDLSFNKISKLEPEEFAHLRQLEELHLQQNLITVLQPQIFDKLDKLKVLDLSFNLLTTLHPSTYVSLLGFGTDVALRGNSWICDCNMRFLQRAMAVDRIKGLKTWSVECSSPLSNSGTNLMELDRDDFKCPDSDPGLQLQKEITVPRGSRILLKCSEPDAVWWTPNGQRAGSQDKDGLLITDITGQDEGLYVCMSKSHQILSIFNVQIREKIRKSRNVPQEIPSRSQDKMIQLRNSVTQSRFALAVSLSVIITFIVAFILGVFLQPYICVCWQKIKTRKQKPQTATSEHHARQEQYVNEAYLHCEDVDDFEPHRERRVTFSEYTEEGNMQYYDTVAGDVQQGNSAVIGAGQASSDSSDESGNEDGKRNSKNVKKIEFERIPDSTKRNSLSSQSSHSSREEKILKNNCSTPNTSQFTEEQVQKSEVATIEVSQISIKSHDAAPGFSSEPFADWSPHQHGSSIMDPDLDNGDQFDFSDSVRSGSPMSPSSLNDSFKQPNFPVPVLSLKSSSSSSEISDDEPTHYTVNVDSEEEAEVFEKNVAINKESKFVKSSSSSSDSERENHQVVETRQGVDFESKEMVVKNELQKEEQTLPNTEQKPPTVKKRRAPLPPPRKPSSSSSDSEDEIQKLKQENTQLVTKQETKTVHFEEQAPWPVVDLEKVRKVKRRLDFKVRYAAHESSSSSGSEDERIYEEIKDQDEPKLPIYSKQESSMATTDIRPQSGTSSSSDSEEEQENYYENIQLVTSSNKPPVVMLEQDAQWPVINLVRIPKVKRRLHFITSVPTVDASSSSDSEDEHLYVNVTQVQGKVPLGVGNVSKPGSGTSSSSESEDEREIKVIVNQESLQQTTSPVKPPTAEKLEESQWPVIDLVRIPKVKRRLDLKERVKVTPVPERVPSTSIKVPKPESGTSSSSESEDDREIKVKPNQENLQPSISPIQPSTAVKPHQESQWPVIDLVKLPNVKRRLDIKTTVLASESSSSDSEDERVQVNVTQMQGKLPSIPVSVQKPGSGTSSSSESEDEREIQIVSKENLQQVAPPTKQPSIESPWPVIDLGRIPKVKQRLDIKERVNIKVTPVAERVPSTSVKVPKPDSGTSSSSESENEREINEEKLYKENILTNKQATESTWPVINLMKVQKVKRRLDIKTTVPVVDSSSSSDSEDERVYVNVTPVQVQGKLPSTPVSVQQPGSGTSSSSESEDEQEIKIAKQPTAESQWPLIDLVRIPKVKRRLDIKEKVNRNVTLLPEKVPSTIVKIPKPESRTSSSSESEDEREIKEAKQENIQIVTTPNRPPPESQWPVINLVTIPKVKQRLDFKERVNVNVALVPERVPSTSIRVPKQDSGTSSSSKSEDERELKFRKNLQQATAPIKPPVALKPNQWPMIDLVKVTKVKRRLDIKPTIPVSESSSSASEDDSVQVNVTQVQGKLPLTPVSVQKPDSETSSSSESEDEREIQIVNKENLQQIAPPARRPNVDSPLQAIDLVRIPKLKRRLDIKQIVNVKVESTKMPKSDSGTSSSSESDDEQKIKVKVNQENFQQTISPTKPPTAIKPNQESQWPVINLANVPKVKQRLDIKTTVLAPQFSSSDSEDERVQVNVTQLQGKRPSTTTPVGILKPGSETSSSSESEDEREIKIVNKENVQEIAPATKQPVVDSPWPGINLARIPKPRQRLDIKERTKVTPVQEVVPSSSIKVSKPESGTSSSSESEDKTIEKVGITSVGSRVEPQTQWPTVDLRGITRIKRRLDFKIPSRSPPLPISSSKGSHQLLDKDHSSSSSSSDDEQNAVKSSQILVGQSARLPSQTSIGLDIKGPSVNPALHESSSSSDDEPKLSSGSIKSQDKDFIKASPILSIPRNPTKNTQNIELEKYKVVTDDLRGKSSSGSPSPVVTPELQSKWATMNLGLSRFRKRLDITRTSSPSSPPPISPKQDQLIPGLDMPNTKSVIVTEQVAIAPSREQNVDSSSSSSESEDDSKLDDKLSRVEVDFVSPQMSLSNIPKVKRSLNVTTVQKKSPSSSSSDEETANAIVPDLSVGIPRVKRRLDVKAPTPPASSSSSDDEKVYAHKFSDVTDQRSIEYKRTIMKSSSMDSYASKTEWETRREFSYVGSNTQTPKKLSLDNIKRKLLPSKQNELPPNLRWTSVGSHLSEHPLPIPKRHQDSTSTRPMSSPPPMPKHDSSDSSSSDDEQKDTKTTLIVTQKTYNPRSVTFNTSSTVLRTANFEDRAERRGLSALKAMSSDRKNWESNEIFTETAPVSVDYPPDVQLVYRRAAETKTKISQPQANSVSISSPETIQRRLEDMTYSIPSYRRHMITSTEIPEGPPPPIPSTPLPEESTDFTWRSPQSSLSRGHLGHYNVQRKTTVEESVDEAFFDNPNISAV